MTRPSALALALLLLVGCSALAAPQATPTHAPPPTEDRGPIYGPKTITMRDFMLGRTMVLKPNETFDLDEAVPDTVQIDDSQIVAADSSAPRTYRAIKAGTTAVKVTYNLCQGITSSTCGDPSLLVRLTVIVQ